MIVLDLETAPLSAEDQERFAPPFEPSATFKEPETECPEYTNGTLKKPETECPDFPLPKRTVHNMTEAEWLEAKTASWAEVQRTRRKAIEAWTAGKVAAWESEQVARAKAIADSVLAKRAAWLDGAQLDAMRCRICAVGVLDSFGGAHVYLSRERRHVDRVEEDLINCVWEWIADADTVAGHNITGYDLPMLEQRSAILGIQIPPGIRARNRRFYNTDKFIDTLDLWPKKLDLIGKAMGIGGKPGDMSGKDFWRADEATQREYLTWDLMACSGIIKRFGGEGAE